MRCEHACHPLYDCNGNGKCNILGECECDACYSGEHCEFLCGSNTSDTTQDSRGQCVDEFCRCESCYSGAYCELECSARGSCVQNAISSSCVCTDTELWGGTRCDEARCPGSSGVECNGHGVCNKALHQCYCEPGWGGNDCSDIDCPGEPDCSGHGQCNLDSNSNPICQCSASYFGTSCEHHCANGVIVMPSQNNTMSFDWETGAFIYTPTSPECSCNSCWTGKECNILCSGYGTCNTDTCDCDPLLGWRGDTCEVPGCPGYDGLDCTGHGECISSTHTCICDAGWRGVACHQPDCPGEPDCFNRGTCVAENAGLQVESEFSLLGRLLWSPVCKDCQEGWMGTACNDPCVNGVQDPPNSGNCVCEPGWTGVGCNSECSGNGHIVDGVCVCTFELGFKGELCDVPGCPGINGLDCSGHGDCDSAEAECTCDPGWRGIGCQYPDCPGDPDCYNRGSCNSTVDPPVCVNCHSDWMGIDCGSPCLHLHGTQVCLLLVWNTGLL
ncbi:uncharacterized protein LOC144746990 [Ciona intestinalis]